MSYFWLSRARLWAMQCNREDFLENLQNLHKSYRLCADHFEQKMFTNHLCERLCANAFPTLFPPLERRATDIAGDHSYSRQQNYPRPLLVPERIDLAQAGLGM